MKPTSIQLVAIGSPHGDDRAGWEVAEQLRTKSSKTPPAWLECRKAQTPSDLLMWLDGVEVLLIVDACRGLKQTVGWRRWRWPTDQLESMDWSGTHNLGLVACLRLAETLEMLPTTTMVWGIEAQQCDPLLTTDKLSARVRSSVDEVARDIIRLCEQLIGSPQVHSEARGAEHA